MHHEPMISKGYNKRSHSTPHPDYEGWPWLGFPKQSIVFVEALLFRRRRRKKKNSSLVGRESRSHGFLLKLDK